MSETPFTYNENKVRMHLSYDGTGLEGWQKQLHTENTIQFYVEKALSQLFAQDIICIASGRTDAGVHARQQVIHFKAPKELHKYNLLRGMQSLLPDQIVVKEVFRAPDQFHAQHSCTSKHYKYRIWNHAQNDAFERRYSLHVWKSLNLQNLQACADIILGSHDFSSFQNVGTELSSTVRTMKHAKWTQVTDNIIEFDIIGDGFLKQMVRNLVACMLHLNSRSNPALEMQKILDARNRQAAPGVAEAQALYLQHVYYSEALDSACVKL